MNRQYDSLFAHVNANYVPIAIRKAEADLKLRQMLSEAKGTLTADFAANSSRIVEKASVISRLRKK